jgi:Glycosyl hydrolases family 2, sugar binding domain
MFLEAEGAVHVMFRKPTTATNIGPAPSWRQDFGPVAGPWTVRFQPGRGAPDNTVMKALSPLNESSIPGIRHFAGVASYSATFEAPKGWSKGQTLILDLGDAREVAEVRINGQTVGYAWHAPYRVDVTGAVKPGRNQLEVRVGTLWVNRLIGDAQPGATKLTNTALPTYRPDAPLQKAGLIGPVKLMGK